MCDCDWRRIAKAEAGWTLRRCSRSGGGSTRLTSKSRDHLSAQREANGARMRRVDVDGTAGAHQQQPSNNKRNIWLPQQTVSGGIRANFVFLWAFLDHASSPQPDQEAAGRFESGSRVDAVRTNNSCDHPACGA
jgi:hypothetical protein